MPYIRGSISQCDSILTTKDPKEIENFKNEYYICDESQKYGTNERCNGFKSSYTAPKMAKHTCIHIRNSKSSNQTNKTRTNCVSKNTLEDCTNNTLDNNVSTPRFKISQRIPKQKRRPPCCTQWTCGTNMFSKNEKV